MPPSVLRVVIAANPPARLDKALARDAPAEAHLSRSRIARLIADGAVTRGGAVIGAPTHRPQEAEAYDVHVPEAVPLEVAPEPIPLEVVHEDADLVVVEKPAGMVVHPAPGSAAGTLVNALLHRLGDRLSGIGGVRRPGIVHRIDKDTSGLLVVAKTDRAHHGLAEQFAAHSVERSYIAFCHGIPDPADPRLVGLRGVTTASGALRVATGLGRHPSVRQLQAVTFTGGRRAITHLRVTERFAAAACLECRLETGRTHQIRAHLAYLGHPLIGDPTYGGRRRMPASAPGAAEANAFTRQALHAATLGFLHPETGEAMRFSSPLPDDLRVLAAALADSPPRTLR